MLTFNVLASECDQDKCAEACRKKYGDQYSDYVSGNCLGIYERVSKCNCYHGPPNLPSYITRD